MKKLLKLLWPKTIQSIEYDAVDEAFRRVVHEKGVTAYQDDSGLYIIKVI